MRSQRRISGGNLWNILSEKSKIREWKHCEILYIYNRICLRPLRQDEGELWTGWKVIFMLHSKEVQIDFHLSCTFCFIILTLSNFFFCFRVFCSIENLKVCRNKKKLLRKKRFYVAFCVKFVCSLNKINVKIRLKEMRRVRGFGAYHDPGNGTDINQTTEKSFWLSTYLQHATLRISRWS